jgi:hypothetical protein
MYVRKLLYRENLHHATGTTYDNTSTSYFLASTADNWTMSYNSMTGGNITGPAVASEVYLSNFDSFSLENQMIFEVACSGTDITDTPTTGMGMIFMADDKADSFTNAYRLRQTVTTIYIEKTGDGGTTWSTVGSASLSAGGGTTYHYRVYYSKADLDYYGLSFEFEEGNFQVFRGTSQEEVNNTSVLTCTDSSSPLTSGGYMAFYSGVSCVGTYEYMGCYRLWELDVTRVKYTHEVDEVSTAEVYLRQDPDVVIQRFDFSDRVEIWNSEETVVTNKRYLRIVFDGTVTKAPFSNRVRKIELEGILDELVQVPWHESTAQTGTIESTLQTILPEDGDPGVLATNTTTTTALHRQNIDIASQNTNRTIAGASSFIDFKKMLKEVGGFMFYHPDGRFFIRDSLVTSPSLTISSMSKDNNITKIEYLIDGSEMVNYVDGYYNGFATPNNTNDATSVSSHGVRGIPHVDMKIESSTVSGNVGANLTSEYADLRRVVVITTLQRGFDIFPGFRVDAILAGTDVGTNSLEGVPDTDTNTWTQEPCTCNKVMYDSAGLGDGNYMIFLAKNDPNSLNDPVRRHHGFRSGMVQRRNTENLYSLDV